jgi:hypothetical protein
MHESSDQDLPGAIAVGAKFQIAYAPNSGIGAVVEGESGYNIIAASGEAQVIALEPLDPIGAVLAGQIPCAASPAGRQPCARRVSTRRSILR